MCIIGFVVERKSFYHMGIFPHFIKVIIMSISKAQKAINEAVTVHLKDGVSLDITAQVLLTNNVVFNAIESTIHNTGVKLGLILTDKQVTSLVTDSMKDQAKPNHFTDVISLAGKIESNQITTTEKLELVQTHFKTNLKVSKHYSKYWNEERIQGEICSWIASHPEATASEVHASSILDNLKSTNSDQRKNYIDQMLGAQKFFTDLYIKNAE